MTSFGFTFDDLNTNNSTVTQDIPEEKRDPQEVMAEIQKNREIMNNASNHPLARLTAFEQHEKLYQENFD